MLLVALVLLIQVTRECGLIRITWTRTQRESSREIDLQGLRQLSRVKAVWIDDGLGDRQVITLAPSGAIIKLAVRDRVSHWPLGSYVPLVGWGTATNHLYFDVARSADDGRSWDRWGVLGHVEATTTMTVLGLLSHRDYRHAIIRADCHFEARDFTCCAESVQ